MKVRGSLARRLATDPDEHPHRGVSTAAERRTLIRNTTLVSRVGLGVLGAVTGAAAVR